MNKEQIFLVGGAVRDVLLGLDPKDKDYVVVGHSEDDMFSFIFQKDGKEVRFEQVGKDFPVFLHPIDGCEYALARKERKTGAGYNGFSVDTENVSLEDDLFRRDLTINAMAMDHKGNIIDPYNGQEDLKNGILRHVSKHFAEDPVRILRIARFSARYNFSIADNTIEMMQEMVKNGEFDSLTSERVWKEFEKVLGEQYLNNFFNNLEKINALIKVPGFSKIEETDFFNFIRKNGNKENIFTLSLLHAFSQMSREELLKWKMPSDEQQKINQFSAWKNNEQFYSNLSTDDKLNFIQLNRSLQNQDKSLDLIDAICFYQSWKYNINNNADIEKQIFMSDIEKLKLVDYPTIVNKSKELKIKPNELIKQAQIETLGIKQQTMKPKL